LFLVISPEYPDKPSIPNYFHFPNSLNINKLSIFPEGWSIYCI
jgi:hypothetical protein